MKKQSCLSGEPELSFKYIFYESPWLFHKYNGKTLTYNFFEVLDLPFYIIQNYEEKLKPGNTTVKYKLGIIVENKEDLPDTLQKIIRVERKFKRMIFTRLEKQNTINENYKNDLVVWEEFEYNPKNFIFILDSDFRRAWQLQQEDVWDNIIKERAKYK